MKSYNSLATISSLAKGVIVEQRVSELIQLYGNKALAVYKPVNDDEGIDIIVKQKGARLEKTLFLQVKSRYNLTKKGKAFVSSTKTSTVSDNYRMSLVFCYFDFEKGDLHDYLWFIPAPDFLQKANKLKGRLGFVASPHPGKGKKWDKYLIKKKELANEIIQQMKRL